MEFSAKNIANILNGVIEGDPEITVTTISKIEEGEEGTISFLANPKYSQYVYSTASSIVLVNKDFKPEKKIKTTLIRVDDAYAAFATLLEFYHNNYKEKTGIHEMSFIHESATIGKNVYVAPFVYIGEDVVIKDNVKIYPNTYISHGVLIDKGSILASGVKIYNDCIIGKDCILHAGVVVGCDGFGFAPQPSDYKKVPQVGNVIIEDNVEIGANTTIDRATIGSTIIRRGVKLDNLIQVAHNVEIGEHTVIAAQTGISGSTKLGKDCMIGGQVGFAGHITIADGVKLAAQSGVASSIKKENHIEMGAPSFPIKDFQRSYIYFKKLPSLADRIEQLEKQLNELKKDIKE